MSSTLRGAIARGRVAHGYLLCGPRGVGKTTLARVLAMALNCENKRDDGEPCGECTSCRHIWSGSASLDVVEIDAASNRGVDDARDLRERALYAPSGDDRYKVYIVDEAHMLTREAWNALLKILEEPPPRVVFVFATTEPQKIAQMAAPVLSRLQRFDLKRIGPADIRERLDTVLAAEKVEAAPDALAMIARAADGSMRDALSLADQVISIGDGPVTVERVRDALGLVPEDEYLTVLGIIRDHRASEVFPLVNRLGDAGVDFAVFLAGFTDVLRGQLAVALGGKAESVSPRIAEALVAQRDSFSAGDLLRMLAAISTLEPNFRKSGQQQMLVEMLLVRLALIDRTVSIEDLLRGMGSGGGAGAPAIPAPRAASRAPQPPAPPPRQASAAPVADYDEIETGGPPSPAAQRPIERERSPEQLARARDAMDRTAQSDSRERITTEALKQERIGKLRQQDPALGAAIDALDLELLD
ncbi:MAG: DNA polymerase III subunit gamma/tau [Gemmatimonadota bacterium]|nr:DNA polymerase III subunit gamma/tau [Gemmatimonadota bacterium]